MKRMIRFWLLSALFFGSNSFLQAETPYSDNIDVQRVNIAVDRTLDQIQATVSSVEGTVQETASDLSVRIQNGMNSLSKGLEELAKTIDKLAADLKTAGNSVAQSANSIVPGTSQSASTGAQAPSGNQNTGKELGQMIKQFFISVGQLAKAFWGWVKAAWAEITGPSKEEAPLTNAVNEIRTDWEEMKMKQAAKKVNRSAGQMFNAFGNFFRSVFK